MNSLGSWIDRGELDRLVAVVGPSAKSDSQSPKPSTTASLGDPPKESPLPWNRPTPQTTPSTEAKVDPAPAAPPSTPERFPVAEEVEKFRIKVAAIKDKARSLGVLSPGSNYPPNAGPGEVTSPPPSPSPQPGSSTSYTPPGRTAKLKPNQTASASPLRTTPEFRVPQGPLRLRLESFGEWAATLTRAQAVVVADSQGDLVFERGASGGWVSSVTMVASAGERAGRHLSISGNTLIHIDLPADRKLAILPCQTKFGHLSVGLVVPKALDPSMARSIADAITAVIARQ